MNSAPYRHIIRRDLTLAFRGLGDIVALLVYSTIVVTMFVIALGDIEELPSASRAAIIWVSALLFCQASTHRLFQLDYHDGSLQQLWLAGLMNEYVVLAKLVAYWMVVFVPLIIFTPLLGILIGMTLLEMGRLMLVMLLASPVFAMIAMLAAVLTLQLKRSQLVIPIMTLPLYIPITIFAIYAVYVEKQLFFSSVLLLCSFTIFGLPLVVMASALALKYTLRG